MAPGPCYRYKAVFLRGVDGDSAWFTIDYGFREYGAKEIRVKSLWCPEKNAPGGQEAKRYTTDLLTEHPNVVIETEKNRLDGDVQSFARWVGTVWLDTGELLAERVAAAGHGVHSDTRPT